MADHAHVAGREAELRADGLGRLLVVEGHHQHRPLALRQPLEAIGDARLVEARRDLQVGHRQVVGIALEQLGAAALAAALVHHREAAGAEHEREHPLRLAQPAGAQLGDGVHHDVLHQVGGGVGVAQMAQAVAPDPRREQPVELGLGIAGLARRGGGDAPGDAPLRRLGGRGVDGFHGRSIAKRRRK